MDKYIIIIRNIVCFICFFLLLWGCDKPAEPPPESKVVTKKIATAKKDTPKPQPSSVPVSAPKKQEVQPKPAAVKPDAAKKPTSQAVAPSTPKAEVPAQTADASVPASTKLFEIPGTTGFYNPEGKLDPFAPLFREKPETLAVKPVVKTRIKPLTPLEKVDLSQLKLVGIIIAPSGNKALVKEASGKGYIVKKGTYIGIHSGKIVEIKQDKVIVEEEVEDIYGKISATKKTLQLQKPSGE